MYISPIKFIAYILLLIIPGTVYLQVTPETQLTIDSLQKELNIEQSDSVKLRLSVAISELKIVLNLPYWDSIRQEANQLNCPIIEANAYNHMGVILKERGEILKALKYYHESLKLEEKHGNLMGLGTSLNNIGVLYHNMGENDKAITYYRRSLNIAKQLELPNLADRYWNIATWFAENNDSSTYYLRLAGDEYYKLGGDYGLGSYHYVLGTIQSRSKLYQISSDHFKQAIYHYKKLNHLTYVIRAHTLIAQNAIETENFLMAEKHADLAMDLSNDLENVLGIMQASDVLYKVYLKRGDYKKALSSYKLFVTMSDSVKNMELVAAAIRQNISYEYEKEKVIRETEYSKVLELNKEKEKRQNLIITASVIGLLLVLVFAFFIQSKLKVTRKQKDIIEIQKQEMTDSIQYAKRIQSAILPQQAIWSNGIPNSFVLYKPKDVVAGDFYWMESVAPTGKNKSTKVLFAAADCTGHGVPGAMVSVVCNNALNRSVREHGLIDPGQILDKTREIVVQEFEKSEEDVKDGMDIALCSLEGNKLQYAGAHNPLWVIRNGEIIETKANKQPIGQFDNPEPYTTHSFDLEPGDSIYIFSDGYVDQFGGEKGKKFKAKAFRELLLSIQGKSMEEQKTIIDDTFETWRGSLEQIDDVCVIGVKV